MTRAELLGVLGIQFDTFRQIKAEDFWLSPQDPQTGLERRVFVDPQAGDDKTEIRKLLNAANQSTDVVIEAPLGGGKTTLLGMAAASLRAQPERRLDVSMQPSDDLPLTPGLVAQAGSAALLAQVIEQFAYRRQKLGPRQRDGLNELIGTLPEEAQAWADRALQLVVEGKEVNRSWGVTGFLGDTDELASIGMPYIPVVRYIVPTDCKKSSMGAVQQQRDTQPQSSEPSLSNLWKVADSLGFRNGIKVKVDVQDSAKHETAASVRGVLRERDKRRLPITFAVLTEPGEDVLPGAPRINVAWTEKGLMEALFARFRAADSSRRDFSDLVEGELDLNEIALKAARDKHGGLSPRRFFGFYNDFLNTLAAETPFDSMDFEMDASTLDELRSRWVQ